MNLVDRYLGKSIVFAILTVLFIVAGTELFILLIGEFGDIGHRHYTLLSAFIYSLLVLPDQLYQLFPMIGLLGMLMALGVLANHSELVILQAGGLSPLNITFSVLKTIVLLLIVVSFVGEVIAPKTSELAEHYKSEKLNAQGAGNAVAYDLWLNLENDYLHIHEMESTHVLHGVSWYHFDAQGNLLSSSVADTVTYQEGQWVAKQVKQTNFSPEATHVVDQQNVPFPFQITPSILRDSIQRPSDLSLHALHKALEFRKDTHSESDPMQLAFWRRIMQPVASLVMILLAIPFVFGPLRHVSHSLRLVVGVGAGFAFYYLNQFFGPVVLLFHWSPLVGALLPIFVFGILGILLLRST